MAWPDHWKFIRDGEILKMDPTMYCSLCLRSFQFYSGHTCDLKDFKTRTVQ